MLLKESGIELTELEKESLNCILSQGSFFEETGGNEAVKNFGCCFIGYWIDEDEVPGCRGALSSLEKKGVINVIKDYDKYYSINYELTFKEDGYYHEIDFGE